MKRLIYSKGNRGKSLFGNLTSIKLRFFFGTPTKYIMVHCHSINFPIILIWLIHITKCLFKNRLLVVHKIYHSFQIITLFKA